MLQSRSNLILLITRLLPSNFWWCLMYLNLHGCHWYIWKEIMKQLPPMINSTSSIIKVLIKEESKLLQILAISVLLYSFTGVVQRVGVSLCVGASLMLEMKRVANYNQSNTWKSDNEKNLSSNSWWNVRFLIRFRFHRQFLLLKIFMCNRM